MDNGLVIFLAIILFFLILLTILGYGRNSGYGQAMGDVAKHFNSSLYNDTQGKYFILMDEHLEPLNE